MTLGKKYKFKPGNSLPPGYYGYHQKSLNIVKPRSTSTFINSKSKKTMKRVYTPGPGEYDSYIKPFGSNMSNVTFGSKYKKFKDSDVPPIGLYNHVKSFETTKPRVPGVIM